MKKVVFSILVVFCFSANTFAGDRFNFNAGWLVKVGAEKSSFSTKCDDSQWQQVTLPHSYNQHEAFARRIDDLTDTTAWYRKHFVLPTELKNAKKFFIEFEGVRFAARVFQIGRAHV